VLNAFTKVAVKEQQDFRNLCWFDSSTAKIPRRLGAKKKPGNHGTEQTMDGELAERMKGTQDDVECDPGERNPAPSCGSEHKRSTENREDLDEFHPQAVVLERQELGKVVSKTNRADPYM
jgi:hypothetical protein